MSYTVKLDANRVQTTDPTIARHLKKLKDTKLLIEGHNCDLWVFKVPEGFKIPKLSSARPK